MKEQDFQAQLLRKVNREKLEQSIAVLKEKVGADTAESVKNAFSDGNKLSELLAGLGEKEAEGVIRILNSPETVKKIISSPRIAETVRSFVGKNRR